MHVFKHRLHRNFCGEEKEMKKTIEKLVKIAVGFFLGLSGTLILMLHDIKEYLKRRL
jgi:hypothetical protein